MTTGCRRQSRRYEIPCRRSPQNESSVLPFSTEPRKMASSTARLGEDQLVGVDGGVDRLATESLPVGQLPAVARPAMRRADDIHHRRSLSWWMLVRGSGDAGEDVGDARRMAVRMAVMLQDSVRGLRRPRGCWVDRGTALPRPNTKAATRQGHSPAGWPAHAAHQSQERRACASVPA